LKSGQKLRQTGRKQGIKIINYEPVMGRLFWQAEDVRLLNLIPFPDES
jgi:hypothetical protein